MDNQELILNQYRIYVESKDAFIDRTFETNRFYMVLIVVMALAACALVYTSKYFLCSCVSTIGVLSSCLWWMNQDAYNVLIKIKYSNILEKMEESLPFAAHKMEYDSLQETIQDKKSLIFVNTQKAFAFGMFLMFLILFLISIIPFLYDLFKINWV